MEELTSIVPDPRDGFACLRYIDAEAAAGHVGSAIDRAVLKHLVQNTWRKTPRDPRQVIGEVSLKMAALPMLSQVIGVDRRTVQRSLRNLESTGWLDIEAAAYGTGKQAPNLIRVLLDQQDHDKREKSRAAS